MNDATVRSADGVRIHYRVGGHGDVALVFLHGAWGNTHWWDEQLQHFGSRYRVIAIDFAGHGGSGRNRRDWTVRSLAEDVISVADRLALGRMVLVAHSMSSVVALEAAALMPGRVLAIVPVDALQDAQWHLPADQKAQFLQDLRNDYETTTRRFFTRFLFLPTSPPSVIEGVVTGALTVPPDVVIPVLDNVDRYDAGAALARLRLPIRAINTDRLPTKLDVNRRFATDFDVAILPGVGHFPMLEAPDRFDALLDRILQEIGATP